MILLDTSVIIDARDKNSPWNAWAQNLIASAIPSEGAAVDTVILAEACVRSTVPEAVPEEFKQIGIQILDLPALAALSAGKAYAIYVQRRKDEGQIAPKIPLPDFFIGAHAEAAGFKVATRDVARFKTYYPSVQLITP